MMDEIKVPEKLSLIQRLNLLIKGYTFIGYYKDGWREARPIYVFKYKIHGLVASPTYGFDERLECPECDIIVRR